MLTGRLASEPGYQQRLCAAVRRHLLIHAPAETLCLGAEGTLSWIEARSILFQMFDLPMYDYGRPA